MHKKERISIEVYRNGYKVFRTKYKDKEYIYIYDDDELVVRVMLRHA